MNVTSSSIKSFLQRRRASYGLHASLRWAFVRPPTVDRIPRLSLVSGGTKASSGRQTSR